MIDEFYSYMHIDSRAPTPVLRDDLVRDGVSRGSVMRFKMSWQGWDFMG